MALTYVPMTELEAVNEMLQAIGELPVNEIPASGVSDAILAQTTLHRMSRRIQTKGLACNSESYYPLTRDSNNKIPIPGNTIKIDAYYTWKQYVQRGGFLYDREDHTYTFDESTVYVDIVFFLEFSDLPQHVRSYITARAAYKLQAELVGSKKLEDSIAQDVQETKIEFVRAELQARDHNILHQPGSWEVYNRRV